MTVAAIIYWLQQLANLLPWIGVCVFGTLFLIFAVTLLLKLIDTYRLFRQPTILLELTPPAQTARTPEATQRLFTVLHGLYASRPLVSKLLRQKVTFSLEVTSSREQGIRYIMRVPQSQAGFFEQAIVSYLPSIRTRRIADYLPNAIKGRHARVLSFKQTGHFAYPLQTQGSLNKADPISYLTGMMTRLVNDELVIFQLVVSPTKVRDAELIAHRLLNNEELVHTLGKRRISIVQGVFDVINTVLFGIMDAIGDTYHGPSKSTYSTYQRQTAYKHDVAARIKPARTLGTFEQDLAESVNSKVREQLYLASIRAIIVMKDRKTTTQRVEGVRSTLEVFSIPGYQALKARYNFPRFIKERYRLFALHKRLLSPILVGQPSILSASELALLYHFPTSLTHKAENLVTSLSKVLPATIDLKRQADAGIFDVVFGRNNYHGDMTAIGLTAAERERHVYIIGGTGNGKTTMLEYAIVQDIQKGKGVAIVDPHGDSAQRLLNYIPKERINDVIYLNPRDLDYPIGLNLLELPEGLSGSDLAHEKDLVTEAIISVLQKVFDENGDTNAYRIERILRNSIHTAFTIENATLFTILRLLTDSPYRKQVTKNLKDESLKRFWKEELDKAGDYQRVKIAGAPIARIERYERSEAAKRMLEQTKSTINFEDILNSSKILICNFSKGKLGEDTSTLFGITILAKLQLAAWRRGEIAEDKRAPFYLYVDEFQNFASQSFMSLFSEARKYKLFVTMAQQSVSQLSDQAMLNTILDNVGTVVAFRSKSPETEQLLLYQLKPFVEEGEIGNLPSYNFYIKISAVNPQEPVSGETIVLKNQGDLIIAQEVIDRSRENYGRRFVEEDADTQKISKPEGKKGKDKQDPTEQGFIPKKRRRS